MMAEQATDLRVQQGVIRRHFIATFLLLLLLFWKNSIWFYLMSLCIQSQIMAHPSSIWVSSLRAGIQLLVDYSHKLCDTITLSYLAGRTLLQIQEFIAGWCLSFSVGSVQVLSHTKDVGVKAPGRNQLDFFMFSEFCRPCLQQWGLAIRLWKATYCLGSSLDCLTVPMEPLWLNGYSLNLGVEKKNQLFQLCLVICSSAMFYTICF